MKNRPTAGKKRKKVGLLLMTENQTGFVAILQKRGERNWFKDEPQTWPGVCQATVEGKINGNDAPIATLIREILEELEHDAHKVLLGRVLVEGFTNQVIYRGGHTTIFGLCVPKEIIPLIRLEPITGGLVEITEQQVPSLIVAKEAWRTCPHMQPGIVVTRQAKAALIEAFKRFKPERKKRKR